MGTVLRLGFAMGGGVSLGTFCGAALTEAIKLLMIFGKDAQGAPFDAVKVDVFSGASAGAMSLAVMLRTLADPPSDPADPKVLSAVATLDRMYADAPEYTAIRDNDPRKWRELLAAQLAQDAQRDVWVRKIGIKPLLGKRPTGNRDLSRSASLLDSGAVEEIARDILLCRQAQPFPNRRVLADRVLYCCTLANLSPIAADARAELPGPKVGYIGLSDGLRSSVRRELRVFDLDFDLRETDAAGSATEIDSPSELLTGRKRKLTLEDGYPARWCRYQESGGETPGAVGDLTSPRTWKKIAATAIASGAFPFAFAPVVLTRKNYEFGDKLWPAALKGTAPAFTEYPFSYIDGGTFNNEPIREAFRLAAFIDAQETKQTFERLILFVDPFVSDEKLALRVPIHATRGLQAPAGLQPLDGFDPIDYTTLDRLLPHLGTLIGALSDESRVVEADKIFQVRDRFDMRDRMRTFLLRSLTSSAADPTVYEGLRDFCVKLLERNRADSLIPPTNLSLHAELERVIREAPETGPLKALSGGAKAFLDKPDTPGATLAASDPQGAWLRALAMVALDLSMDLEGKSSHARLLPIAPFTDMLDYRQRAAKHAEDLVTYRAAIAAGKSPKPPAPPAPPTAVKLPGGEVSGFAGFMSEEVRQHDFAAGIHCAAQFLAAADLLGEAYEATARAEANTPDWTVAPYCDELEEGVRGLADRVAACVKASNILNLGWGLDGLALGALAGVASGFVERLKRLGRPTETYELRLYVPRNDLNLDGEGVGNDITTLRDERGLYLQTFAEYHPHSGRWKGQHIRSGPQGQVIPVDRGGLIADRAALSVRVPGEPVRNRANWHPCPVLYCVLDASTIGKFDVEASWDALCGVASLEDCLADPL